MSADSDVSAHPQPTDTSPRPHRDFPRSFVGPIIGAILVLVGVGLFADYLGMTIPERWSGILLLIPAAGFAAAALTRYRRIGRVLDGNIVGLIFGAAVFVGLFLMVFFDLNEKLYGPLILIAVGGGILARHFWPRGQA